MVINDSWFTLNEKCTHAISWNVLLPLGLSGGMSAADAVIQKKIYGSGSTTLIISNEKMNYIMKIVKSLE